MTARQKLLRLPLMAVIGLCLMAGIVAGLGRLGVVLPGVTSGALVNHGPLMIGVLGTLICLERAVALTAFRPNGVAAYSVPLVAGVGSLLLAAGRMDALPVALITVGSAGLVILFLALVRHHLATFTAVMALGAACWLAGNLLWLLGQPVYLAAHWWAAFLILTVVGERLELSRILRFGKRSQNLFLAAVTVYTAGVLTTLPSLDLGVRVAGIGLLALAGWLLRYDIARKTIRRVGLPRFAAACLLAGYAWLGAGGAFAALFGGVRAGPQYEVLLHALLLGFIFSMIFGHALIIFPAITGRELRFHTALYVPLVLLHVSLLARAYAALAGDFPLRQSTATLNAAAILLFFAIIVATMLYSQASRRLTASRVAS